MKKFVAILSCLVFVLLLAACGAAEAEEETVQMTQIGNPWSTWDSIAEAEEAVGFSFGLPEVIADTYTVAEIQTMNGELIEVVYRDEEFEVCVRKQVGEGQDISGDYSQYDTCTEESVDGGTVIFYSNSGDDAVRQQVSHRGYSWSLVAPNGYWGDSGAAFLNAILEQ
jgi:hypothetical protein